MLNNKFLKLFLQGCHSRTKTILVKSTKLTLDQLHEKLTEGRKDQKTMLNFLYESFGEKNSFVACFLSPYHIIITFKKGITSYLSKCRSDKTFLKCFLQELQLVNKSCIKITKNSLGWKTLLTSYFSVKRFFYKENNLQRNFNFDHHNHQKN